MNKNEIADEALRAAGWKRVNDDAMKQALVILDEVTLGSGYDVKNTPDCVADELLLKLTKRLAK